MRYIGLFFPALFAILRLKAQVIPFESSWLTSKTCHYNIYDPSTSGSSRKECIDATFKFDAPPHFTGCTGTLVNRNIDGNHIEFYFLTARHCFYESGNPSWNWEGVDVNFYFNYQSKDAATGSVPYSNRGYRNSQSRLYDNDLDNDTNYQYFHRSRIEVITMQYWGDLALCRILTPLPPHFNITYAGWNPSKFAGVNSYGSFAGIHHPRGDIKKISQTPHILWLETPIATGCYTVTKVVDVLIGWIWKRRWSTSVICKYIDNPKFIVPTWFKGGTEPGASGSGMFSSSNRHFGVLSGGFSACSDVTNQDFYGKLYSNYPNASVKNTLNPEGGLNNRAWVDLFGMPSRKITCYPSLDLPGAPGVSGEYFPAKDYQAENTITLQAVNDINTTGESLNIYPEADYRFRAGGTITLNPGFDAKDGSLFIAEIGGCTSGYSKTTDPNAEVLAALSQIRVPKNKSFDASRYVEGSLLQSGSLVANIYPNPSQGRFTVRVSQPGQYTIKVTDLLGRAVYESEVADKRECTVALNGAPAGTYIVHIGNQNVQFAGKVVIAE